MMDVMKISNNYHNNYYYCTSGGLPHNQAAHSVSIEDERGVYIWTSRIWGPEDNGINADP